MFSGFHLPYVASLVRFCKGSFHLLTGSGSVLSMFHFTFQPVPVRPCNFLYFFLATGSGSVLLDFRIWDNVTRWPVFSAMASGSIPEGNRTVLCVEAERSVRVQSSLVVHHAKQPIHVQRGVISSECEESFDFLTTGCWNSEFMLSQGLIGSSWPRVSVAGSVLSRFSSASRTKKRTWYFSGAPWT